MVTVLRKQRPKLPHQKKVEKKEKKIKKESKKKMNDDIVQQLKDLKELYDSGALTEKEYKKAKKILLD